MDTTIALPAFLTTLFSESELWSFARRLGVASELAGGTLTATAEELVLLVDRHGLLDESFFEQLRSLRPRRALEIDEVARAVLGRSGIGTRAYRQADFETLHELHRRIARTTPLRRLLRDRVLERALSPSGPLFQRLADADVQPAEGHERRCADVSRLLQSRTRRPKPYKTAADVLILLSKVQETTQLRRELCDAVLRDFGDAWHPALLELAARGRRSGSAGFAELAKNRLDPQSSRDKAIGPRGADSAPNTAHLRDKLLPPTIVLAICADKDLNDDDQWKYFHSYFQWSTAADHLLVRAFFQVPGKPDVDRNDKTVNWHLGQEWPEGPVNVANVRIAHLRRDTQWTDRHVGMVLFLHPRQSAVSESSVIFHAKEDLFAHTECRDPYVVQAAVDVFLTMVKDDKETTAIVTERLKRTGWAIG